MKNIRFFNAVLLLSLTSCGSQEPAPIDYRSGISSYSSAKSDSDSISSKKFDIKLENSEENKQDNSNEEKHVLKDSNSQKYNKKFASEEENEEDNKVVVSKTEEPKTKDGSGELESELQKIEETKPEAQPEQKAEISPDPEKTQSVSDQEKTIETLTPNELFIYPVNGKILSQFGEIVNGIKNSGINFEAVAGEKVVASANGKVVHIAKDPKYGNIIIISHSNNIQTAYAHLDSISVSKGQEVVQGTEIGAAGKTGDTEKIIVHFAVREGKSAVDPLKYLKNR